MNKKSRTLIAFASLLLVLTFFFPIWNIDLHAPQYPEGIGLRIWLDKITGFKPNDIQSINGLNHYIGMKTIEPDSIAELKYMPYIIMFMIAAGLLVALTGKRKLAYGWISMFLLLAVVGLYDFYMWEYNYGHELNPDAPIKIPGMTYQPPLLGSKQLLNISAVSMPAISTYIITLSILLLAFAVYYDKKVKRAEIKIEN